LSHVVNDSGFLRHVRACNNARLPGERIAFCIGSSQVGWVAPAFGRALALEPSITADAAGLTLTDATALPDIARRMSERGFYRWRGEAFDVRATADGPVLGRVDRGALPAFGIQATGVHLNGLVRRSDGLHLWVARRANDKALDPGKLDHVVAGGVPAGLTTAETLVKEAAEEAAIPAELAAQAQHVAVLAYAMERAEGLRRDVVHSFDLTLPADFAPEPADGEVEAFELWPLPRVVEAVRETDDFKFNVNLVLIDLFLRLGLVVGDEAQALRTALTEATTRSGSG
jgi:8-oxo-dGTP pyrophosphatase MutT (NUDIX family)